MKRGRSDEVDGKPGGEEEEEKQVTDGTVEEEEKQEMAETIEPSLKKRPDVARVPLYHEGGQHPLPSFKEMKQALDDGIERRVNVELKRIDNAIRAAMNTGTLTGFLTYCSPDGESREVRRGVVGRLAAHYRCPWTTDGHKFRFGTTLPDADASVWLNKRYELQWIYHEEPKPEVCHAVVYVEDKCDA